MNELVLNAAKYAYPDRPGERIAVTVARTENRDFSVSVRDNGIGLPADFDAKASRRLGARLTQALSAQLDATLTQASDAQGTRFHLVAPLEARRG